MKFDTSSDYIWGTHFGGSGAASQANGIAASASGSVSAVGAFVNTVNFNPGPGVTNVTSHGGVDVYVANLVAAPVAEDDSDPGVSLTGSWTSVPNRGGYNNDYLFAPGGDGTTAATWQVPVTTPGAYDVQVSWVPYSNRADNAPYRIYDGNTLLATVRVNQQLPPSGPTVNGIAFQSLGAFPITSGSVTVVLGNDADNYAIADAVRVAPPTPTPALVDNDGPGYAVTGAWTTVGGRGGSNQDYQFAVGSAIVPRDRHLDQFRLGHRLLRCPDDLDPVFKPSHRCEVRAPRRREQAPGHRVC